MKFRCEQEILADVLATAGRAATGRTPTLPVLTGVRLELKGDALTVTGTDLELTIQTSVTVDGQADGVAVLNARLGSDIVRNMPPGAVTIDASGEEIRISSQQGRSEFRLRSLAAEDFPRLGAPAESAVTMKAEAFADALRQVVRAASGDDARPILTGVLLAAEEGGLRLVATDSYRLAVRDLQDTAVLAAGQKVLVPSRALTELGRLLGSSGEVALRVGERDATFDVGSKRLTTRLIDGEFPNYRQLIPSQYPNRLTVGRDALLDAVKRLRPLTAARDNPPVRLKMSADGLDLTVTSQELGTAEESVDARYDGNELVVAFNAEYLSAGVDAVMGDEVVLDTLDPMKPAVLRSAERQDYLYLLMPVRVP